MGEAKVGLTSAWKGPNKYAKKAQGLSAVKAGKHCCKSVIACFSNTRLTENNSRLDFDTDGQLL